MQDTNNVGADNNQHLLVRCSQALQQEGVSTSTVQSILGDIDRDNNRRIDYEE